MFYTVVGLQLYQVIHLYHASVGYLDYFIKMAIVLFSTTAPHPLTVQAI